MIESPLWTAAEASLYLKQSEAFTRTQTQTRAKRRGTAIPHIKIGREPYFRQAALDEWLQQREAASTKIQ